MADGIAPPRPPPVGSTANRQSRQSHRRVADEQQIALLASPHRRDPRPPIQQPPAAGAASRKPSTRMPGQRLRLAAIGRTSSTESSTAAAVSGSPARSAIVNAAADRAPWAAASNGDRGNAVEISTTVSGRRSSRIRSVDSCTTSLAPMCSM
jgi:hypothetical protein